MCRFCPTITIMMNSTRQNNSTATSMSTTPQQQQQPASSNIIHEYHHLTLDRKGVHRQDDNRIRRQGLDDRIGVCNDQTGSGGGVGLTPRNTSGVEDTSYLVPLLAALKNKHRIEGAAGISALLDSSSSTPEGRCNRVAPSPPRTPTKKRRDEISSSCVVKDQPAVVDNLKGSTTSPTAQASSRRTCSNYIAQLSSDIAHNRLSSASPSSVTSFSSSSSSSSRSLSGSPFFPVGSSKKEDSSKGSSSTTSSDDHRQNHLLSSRSHRVPDNSLRMDNIFASAHDALLETFPPPPPLTSLPSSSTKNNAGFRTHSSRHNRRRLEDNRGCDGEEEEEEEDEEEDGDGRGQRCGPIPVTLIAGSLTVRSEEPDTTLMSTSEILQFITVPHLSHHSFNNDSINDFFTPHEVGHMNHLTKCFTDSIFTVTLPENTLSKSTILPVDFLHIYSCCVLRIFILFKNLDVVSLSPTDQSKLFESSVLKALLCMSFLVFKQDTDSWHVPSSLSESKPVEIKVTDLNQILPHHLLQQALAINIMSSKLKFDLWVSILCIVAFFYSPADEQLRQMPQVEKFRDRYIEILFKYLKFKHGAHNASLLFPEILKLMDAILKHCNQVEQLSLALKPEEVKELETLVKSPIVIDSKEHLQLEDSFFTGVSFAKINRRILSSVHLTTANSNRHEDSDIMSPTSMTPSLCHPIAALPAEDSDAKTKREVEELVLRKIMLNAQQFMRQPEVHQITTAAHPDDDTQSDTCNDDKACKEDTVEVSRDKDGTPRAYPSPVSPRAVNILALQRLLLDLCRKDHPHSAAVSPEPPVASTPPAQVDETIIEPTFLASRKPPGVIPSAQLQVLQQRLQQVSNISIYPQRQNPHLENFAKSLEPHSTSPPPPPPVQQSSFIASKTPKISVRSFGVEAEASSTGELHSAIDLSSGRRRRRSSSSSGSVRLPTVPSVPELAAITPSSAKLPGLRPVLQETLPTACPSLPLPHQPRQVPPLPPPLLSITTSTLRSSSPTPTEEEEESELPYPARNLCKAENDELRRSPELQPQHMELILDYLGRSSVQHQPDRRPAATLFPSRPSS